MILQLRLSLGLPPAEATPTIAYPLYAWLLSHVSQEAGDRYHENSLRAISHYVHLRAPAHRPEWVVNLLTQEAVSLFLPVLEEMEEAWLRHKRISCVCTMAERIDTPQAFFDLGEARSPEARLPLDFLTPTSFKQQGRYVIYPQEGLMLQSLCNRWNLCFPARPMDTQVLLPALLAGVRIADYSLRSLRYPLKQASIPSFQGRVVLEAHLPRPESALFRALYCFAPYAGMGIKTALGMGGVTIQGP